MAEYIERTDAIERIRKMASMIGFETPAVAIDCVIRCIERTEAADVAPVVHAKWEDISDFGRGNCFGYCSNCNTEHKAQNPTALKMRNRHCSWCGARMDGE